MDQALNRVATILNQKDDGLASIAMEIADRLDCQLHAALTRVLVD
jgi:hypothetical protein